MVWEPVIDKPPPAIIFMILLVCASQSPRSCKTQQIILRLEQEDWNLSDRRLDTKTRKYAVTATGVKSGRKGVKMAEYA